MACETWIRLQQRVEKATVDLVRQQKSSSEVGRTPAQIATMQALQDGLFEAIAAIQQHEKEHGCQKSTEPSLDLSQQK